MVISHLLTVICAKQPHPKNYMWVQLYSDSYVWWSTTFWWLYVVINDFLGIMYHDHPSFGGDLWWSSTFAWLYVVISYIFMDICGDHPLLTLHRVITHFLRVLWFDQSLLEIIYDQQLLGVRCEDESLLQEICDNLPLLRVIFCDQLCFGGYIWWSAIFWQLYWVLYAVTSHLRRVMYCDNWPLCRAICGDGHFLQSYEVDELSGLLYAFWAAITDQCIATWNKKVDVETLWS